jgi:hypothetical protein
MSLPSAGSLSVGTGGLTIGTGGSAGISGTGDLVVNGNLTVFGGSISAFTSQLYVEDNILHLIITLLVIQYQHLLVLVGRYKMVMV